MTAYHSLKNDIGITNIGTAGTGTDIIGMMLAKKEDGTPAYEEFDAKTLADQFFNSYATPDNIDPEQELLLTQNDWRSGFGLEFYDRQDPKRYFSSIGADLRFRGMAIAGYAPTTVTKPTITAVTLANGGLETWDGANDIQSWTEAAVTWTKVAGARTGGSGSFFARNAQNTGADTTVLSQSVTWNNEYRSRYFHASAWIRATAGTLTVSIYDGVARTQSTAHTGGGAWEKLTVVRQLNVAATELTIEIRQNGGGGANIDVDDIAFMPPTSGVHTKFIDFNDQLYCAWGNNLIELNGTGTGFDYLWSAPATITDLEEFGGNLFIACGTSEDYWYMSTAEAFTRSTAAVKQFQYFCTVNAATPVLWGNDAVNTIRSNTNPINGGAAWSGTTTVDTSYNNITDLVSYSGALYIMKEDMPYYLNSAGAVQNDLAPELKSLTRSTSGAQSFVWLNQIFIPCGASALFKTDATTNEFISPTKSAATLSNFAGRVNALAGDDGYLFAVVNETSAVLVQVLAGREETIDGVTSWIWHPIAQIAIDPAQTAYVSTVYQKRLWVGSSLAADSIYYVPLPTSYGNITGDTNRKFKTNSYFITPWLHGDFRADTKAFIKLTLTMGHSYDADIYITAAYQKLGDSGYTSIGNFTGSSSLMTESKFIPVDASSNNPKSTMMRFKFNFVTNDTTVTPILNNYQVKAILYPTIRTLIHCVVNCAKEVVNKQGVIMKNDYQAIKDTLDNARNASWPVSIRDIDGTTQTVKFLPVPRNIQRMMILKKEKDRVNERLYHVLMLVVPLS